LGDPVFVVPGVAIAPIACEIAVRVIGEGYPAYACCGMRVGVVGVDVLVGLIPWRTRVGVLGVELLVALAGK